ncbi:MAG: hypothetical protein AAGF48_13830 [Pseudomonadota bacterium]
MSRTHISCIVFLLLLIGCAQNAERYQLLDGIGPRFDPVEAQTSTEDLDAAMSFFIRRAGLGNQEPQRNNEDWDEVIFAGFDYIDERCELYIDALHWHNRAKDAAIKEVSIIASATSAIVALTSGSEVTLGILAAAFGLASETIDNTSSALLYEMDPAAVGAVIDGTRTAYEAALLKDSKIASFRSRARASRVIRRYLSFCLPAGIERQINQALNKQNFEGVNQGEGTIPSVVPIGTSEPASELDDDELEEARARFEAIDAAQRQQIAEQAALLRDMNNRVQQAQTQLDNERKQARIRRIQTVLCAPETGIYDDTTQAAVDAYRIGFGDDRTGQLVQSEENFLLEAGSCANAGFLTAFEQGAFGAGARQNGGVPIELARDNAILSLQGFMQKLTNDPALEVSSPVITPSMRDKIQNRRTELGITDGPVGGVTQSLFEALF